MEAYQISTSSTISNINTKKINEEEFKKRIEHPTFVLSTNKKYKNLRQIKN